METKIYTKQEIKQAAEQIVAGELIAFPTETVYGLGADATNEMAVKKVYQAKGRPSDNPLIVHVASVETVEQYTTNISERARQLMQAFWPGSLTMIFQLKPDAFSKTVTGGLTTAAFRFPDNQVTLDLIKTSGRPLVGPSANTSGKPSPTTAQHVFHDLQGKIAGILDDGPTRVGVESTVLDLSTDTPVILRPGAVTKEQIESVIGSIENNHHQVGQNETPKAPGMKYKHYAPKAQVLIVNSDDDWQAALEWAAKQNGTVGIMTTDPVMNQLTLPGNAEPYSLGTDVTSASHALFAGLRYFDDQPNVNFILTEGFPTTGLGIAYMNRLNKSAGGQHFEK